MGWMVGEGKKIKAGYASAETCLRAKPFNPRGAPSLLGFKKKKRNVWMRRTRKTVWGECPLETGGAKKADRDARCLSKRGPGRNQADACRKGATLSGFVSRGLGNSDIGSPARGLERIWRRGSRRRRKKKNRQQWGKGKKLSVGKSNRKIRASEIKSGESSGPSVPRARNRAIEKKANGGAQATMAEARALARKRPMSLEKNFAALKAWEKKGKGATSDAEKREEILQHKKSLGGGVAGPCPHQYRKRVRI